MVFFGATTYIAIVTHLVILLRGLSEPFRRQAEKRLRILESASSLGDLAALNSNRLKGLKGDRKGQFSIRINDQWRICFEWPGDAPGPRNVEIVDYH